MFLKPAISAASLGLAFSAAAQTELTVPEIDAARGTFSYSGDMDFDDAAGSLEVSKLEIRSLLSAPLSPIENLVVLPAFEYRGTSLEFDGVPAAFPIDDEELHSLSLSALAFSRRQGSPWIYGGYARAELASDFQDIGGDDFTFDLAAGVGYRFNDCFTLALGGAVTNLNGDPTFYPGVAFDWIVSDQIRVGLYGPTFVASYSPDENWELSLRGDSGGDVWNITDGGGNSRSIDLTSYRFGLFAARRLSGELWLRAGAGATFGNDIRLTEPDGDRIDTQEMKSGMFGQISLVLKTW
jgi:hypothetical protein